MSFGSRLSFSSNREDERLSLAATELEENLVAGEHDDLELATLDKPAKDPEPTKPKGPKLFKQISTSARRERGKTLGYAGIMIKSWEFWSLIFFLLGLCLWLQF